VGSIDSPDGSAHLTAVKIELQTPELTSSTDSTGKRRVYTHEQNRGAATFPKLGCPSAVPQFKNNLTADFANF